MEEKRKQQELERGETEGTGNVDIAEDRQKQRERNDTVVTKVKLLGDAKCCI